MEYRRVSEAGLTNPDAQRAAAPRETAGQVDDSSWRVEDERLSRDIGVDVVAADGGLGLIDQRSDVRFQLDAFVLPEWRRRRFQMVGAIPAQGPDWLIGPSVLVRPMVERTQIRFRSSRSPVPLHVLWAVGDTRPRFGRPVGVGRKRVSGDGVLAKTLVLLRAGASREPGSVRRRETSPAAGREAMGR